MLNSSTATGWVGDVMTLLRSGIPLTLLIDLCSPDGPRSAEIYADEWPDAGAVRATSPHVRLIGGAC